MQTYTASVIRGDTFNGVQFEYIVNGTPLDLTGSQIEAEFRLARKTGKLTKTISLGDGITLVDAVNGIFTIDPFIADLEVGDHYFDIQLTEASNVIKTYVKGILTVLQDVTK